MRLRMVLLLLLHVSIFAPADIVAQEDIKQSSYQELMASGEKHRKSNELPDALADYTKAAGRALKPEEAARARYRMGQVLELLGDPDSALRSYKESYQNSPYPETDQAVKRIQDALAGSVVSASSIVRNLHQANANRSQQVGPPSVDIYVNFDLDKDTLTTTGHAQVVELAKALKTPEFAAYRFEIAGHTDKSGTDEYNMALSERRARRIGDALTGEFGMNARSLDAKGYGKKELLRTGDSPEDNRVNRRVEVKLLGGDDH